MKPAYQRALRLSIAPLPDTLGRLFQIFGDELIPIEEVRVRYFRNMNAETFKAALGTERIPLPVTTMVESNKRLSFIYIRHLAAYIEARASMADGELAQRLGPENEG